MSCNTCQSKFSLFTRENACPKCGFSFCNKCLKYKCEIPSVGVKKVCGRCFSSIESKKDSKPVTPTDQKLILDTDNELLAPVDITNKLESLENPAKPPIVMYAHGGQHWDNLKRGLEPADQEIVDRLKKLKDVDSKTSPPSVEDIKRRLAILKDQDPDICRKPINIHHVDNRSDQEKTDDLIKEYLERLELSTSNDSASEIRSRLDNLKDFDPSKCSTSTRDDIDEDDATMTKKIIEKALAEAALEKKYDEDELKETEMEVSHISSDDEDQPACVMCEQTADLVRCLGCHGDLYCTICYADNHGEFELGIHKTIPFKFTKDHKSN